MRVEQDFEHGETSENSVSLLCFTENVFKLKMVTQFVLMRSRHTAVAVTVLFALNR